MVGTRRFLVPEIIQSSSMDCGVAALTALLQGHGIDASYGRLREACQTDLDGTSIDAIEEAACAMGLDAEQLMLPSDHVLLAGAGSLPALAVVRLPNAYIHFIVIWRRHGPLVQVLDPAGGRRWTAWRRVERSLFVHRTFVSAERWRQWACSSGFLDPLSDRLRALAVGVGGELLIQRAVRDQTWRTLATIDAGVRLLTALVESGSVRRGRQAAKLLCSVVDRELTGGPRSVIPDNYWSVVEPAKTPNAGLELEFRGAVIVRINGRRPKATGDQREEPLSVEIKAALQEVPPAPAAELLRLLRSDGLTVPLGLIWALGVAVVGTLIEAMLFRGLLDASLSGSQRLIGILMILLFVALMLGLEGVMSAGWQRIGRHLEMGFRVNFLRKVPTLPDRYLRSRLTSDMAERSHSVHRLRTVVATAVQLFRSSATLIGTGLGIMWLYPASVPAVLFAILSILLLPLASQALLAERELRLRTLAGSLGRLHLDALQGLIAIRAHGGQGPIRREYEGLLAEWMRAGRSLHRAALSIEVLQQIVAYGTAVWVVSSYSGQALQVGAVLLIVYWSLNLSPLAQEIVAQSRQYPVYRNVTLRLLEPLSAPEDVPYLRETRPVAPGHAPGVAIVFDDVSVRAGGYTILRDISLRIDRGEHVAIVGPSGAGKSTLVGLLLGWHRFATGQLLLDEGPFDSRTLGALRSRTAWLDPSVQLWNRSLLENLQYASRGTTVEMDRLLAEAELYSLLETLPDGLQTVLGEGGGRLSGGEAQRVRLGRALSQQRCGLAILDEPFRGLGRSQRRSLLSRARMRWRDATLLCVTHDIADTLDFDRVVVMTGGSIAEHGDPRQLATSVSTAYRSMLDSERDAQERFWGNSEWRRLSMVDGQLVQTS